MAETLKTQDENIRRKLSEVGLGNEFFDMIPKPQATTAKKTNKWDYIKTKNFRTAKETPTK